jgi:hypothetical protein
MVHTCNPSTGEVRQEYHEFKAILGHIVRPCLKSKNKSFSLENREKKLLHMKSINLNYEAG